MNIENKLKEIADTLLKIVPDKCGFEGCRGIALFLLEYYKHCKSEVYYDRHIELIEQELSFYGTHADNISFWSGVSGLGWLCNTIIAQNIDYEYNSGIEALNELFLYKMLNDNYSGFFYYDGLHGNLGLSKYFMSLKDHAAISSLVAKLSLSGITDGDMIKWKSNTRRKEGVVDYNISLSHGMSSIVAMLSKIHTAGIEKEQCARLIEGAVNYILAQKLPKDEFVSIFGNYALESMPQPHSSRLAWCYGDLGIAAALWQASQTLGRKDWENEAKSIMLHASKRRDMKENCVMDACFCHGTAGIAHIFNKMWRYTRMQECKDVADAIRGCLRRQHIRHGS